MKKTPNLELKLPESSTVYDVNDFNDNFSKLDTYLTEQKSSHDTEMADLKESVSNGKALVAAAVTAKRVATAATATFETIAANIAAIILGSGNATAADVLKGKTFTNDTGVEQTGTMEDKSGTAQTVTPTLDTANSYLVMTVPSTGKYSTGSKLRAAFSTIRSLIGLTAAKIATGNTILGLDGTYTGQGNAGTADVLSGKTFSTASLSNAVGTMTDKSGKTETAASVAQDTANGLLTMTVPITGKWSTASKLKATFATIRNTIGLTAASMLATGVSILGLTGTYTGLGNATAGDVLSEKTFSTASLSNATGTMADKSGTTQDATPTLDTTNSYLVMTVPSVGKYTTGSKLRAAYSTIRNLIGLTAAKIATGNKILGLDGTYKGLGNATAADVLSGKTFSTASLSNASGSMANQGAKTASLNPGGSYTIPKGYHNGSGKVTAKAKYVKQLNADAIRGFNVATSDYVTSESESFTMPEAGTVYYNGFSASYNAAGTVTCEIYKNGSVVDNRNINSSNRYNYRGTMVRKSFSAAKGDVIKVSATATAGSHSMAHIDATIVYFQ